MDKESRNAFIVIGASLAGLLVISLVFSGRAGDAIYAGPPVHQRYQVEQVAEADIAEAPEDAATPEEMIEDPEAQAVEPVEDIPAETEVAEEAPAEEATEEEVAEAPAEEAVEEDVAEAPAEEAVEEDVAEAPAEEAVEEDVAEAPAEEAPTEVALAGDPAAGERVWRQCQACHQIGDGAQNRVGPMLTGIIDRPKAAVEGFRYSAALQSRGDEGGVWSVEELHGFLANPRGYMPGTSMAFAGLRSESDIDDVIAYMATFE